MAFPTSPTNGQTATVNGVLYTYSSSTTAWNVTTAFTGNILTTTLSASGNVTGNFFLGNGSQLTGVASGTASNIASGTSNVTIVSSGGNVSVGVGGIANLAVFDTAGNTTITGNLLMTGNVIPTANNTHSLGSLAMQWKEVYIGPGSLYINGQEVLSSSADNIVVSANANQNLTLQTSGSGGIRIDTTGNGIIQVQGPLQITAGKNITSSDGNAIQFANPIAVNNLTSQSLNNNLTLSANGTGVVSVTSILSSTGNISSSANISGASVLGTSVIGTTVIGTTLSATANVIGGNITTAGIGNIGTLAVTGTTTLTGNTTAGHVLPAANITYDLGSATAQWRTLYVSGNTINMGGATIQTDSGSGSFAFVPPATVATPNPTGVVFGPGGNISTVTTTAGTITANLQVAGSTTSTVLKITSISYPGDDTAADPAGGQTITLGGSGFLSGAQVLIGTSPMTTVGSVTVVSAVSITFVSPVGTVGNWPVYVVNSDGATAISLPGIAYSGTPTWLTASGNIAQVYEVSALSTTISATGDVPIGYSIYSGSLPSGASLNGANGLISGTTVATASSTTYSFTARATDAQQQDTNRAFTITVNPDVVSWSSPANNSSTTAYEYTAISNVTLSANSAAGKAITYTANTLPTGIALSGSTISGTANTVGNTSTLLTATAATSNRTSTEIINFVIQPDAVTWSSPAANSTGTLAVTTVMSNVTMVATSAAGFGVVYTANTLPTGVSITGANIGGTPTVIANTSSLLTATANTSGRTSTQVVNWVVESSTPPVEYLVVAGGGGGSGGGGGAGGFRTATGYAVTAGVSIAVTVGAGGAAGTQTASNASAGGNSTFGSITSIGGGYGAGVYAVTPGGAGGSGGGGSIGSGSTASVAAGGTATSGQGSAGGTATNTGVYQGWIGAGGGGAGGAGVSTTNYDTGASPPYGGLGGAGLASSITGSSITYAAGGQAYYSSTVSADGAANSGNGGGGSRTANMASAGWNGGSGIVVIRYADTYPAAASTTGSPTITVAGGYRVYKWTTVGSGSITF